MDWIQAYCEFTSRQVSPIPFHRWSALAVLAAALERKCWFDCVGGRFRIYPGQLMVVLVSKSAVTKKTTAARLATRFLKALDPWQCYVLPKKISPQQLMKCLERLDDDKVPIRDPENRRVNSAGFIFAEELGNFFTSEAFNEHLATQINELNDCPPGKHRLEFRSWKADLWQPCITMLGCITPRGIADELPKAARTAGFFGRILWVHQDHTDRRASLMMKVPEEDVASQRALQRALELELREVAKMRGPFTVSKKGEAWFNSWYYDVYEPAIRRLDLPEGEQTGYWGRKDAHVLRVGMTISASEKRDRVLRQRHIELALKWLEEIERQFPAAMAELGVNPYSDFDQRLLEALERYSKNGKKWTEEWRLRKLLHRYGGDRRFTESIQTLSRAQEIEVDRHEGKPVLRRIYSSGRLLRAAGEER